MESNTFDLNDPIAKKLDDNATLERLVRKAVSDAVDKARKLGYLDEKGIKEEHMLIDGVSGAKVASTVAEGTLNLAASMLNEKYTGLAAVLFAYSPKFMQEWLLDRRLTLTQIKMQEKLFEQASNAVAAHFQKSFEVASKAESPSERSAAFTVLENARRDVRLLATIRKALSYMPSGKELEHDQKSEAESQQMDPAWWDTFESFARRANDPWRVDLLARALAEIEINPGAIRLKALWEIGMLEHDDYGKLALFCDACLHIDGLPVMLIEPAQQNEFVCSLDGDVREANLAHVVADLVAAGLVQKSLTQIDATEPVLLGHASSSHWLKYRPPEAKDGDSVYVQVAAYSPVDWALDICRLYQAMHNQASDANYESLRLSLIQESQDNPSFGTVSFEPITDLQQA